jgi:hypothetical protein
MPNFPLLAQLLQILFRLMSLKIELNPLISERNVLSICFLRNLQF